MKMHHQPSPALVIFCFLAALFAGISHALDRPERRYWSPATFPNPQKETDLFFCGLRNKAYVCDPNGNLNKQNESGLADVQDALRRVREETRCSCDDSVTETPTSSSASGTCDEYDVRGYTISVALADYMDMTPEEVDDEKAQEAKAREFAMILRKEWKLGQCNDDVVIFVSAGDEKVWTAVGQVAAYVLTPDLIQTVSKGAQKSFEKKEFTSGVLYMVEQYKLALQGKATAVEKHEPALPFGLPLWLLIVIAVVVVLVLLAVIVVVIRCCCSTKSSYQMGQRTS